MKKFWVYLLAALLLAALAMTCACAEANEAILLGDGSEVEVQVEADDEGIILEDDLSMDVAALPMTEENDGISLDLSPEGLEPATVPADNTVVSNDGAEDFEIIDGVLVKYNGAGGDVIIPNSVTSIGEKAFYECSSLTSVTIPYGVTMIDSHAFFKCTGLTNVSIPNSVITIGTSAFSHCESLTAIEIPDSVTELEKCAFSTCSNLTRISLPSNISIVGTHAGMWSSYYLNYATFKDCNNVTSVTIGEGSSILNWFPCYKSITTVFIRPGVATIDSGTFSRCSGLTSVSIPDSITSIGEDAFSDCKSLTSIYLPESVTSIGAGAFEGCSNLTSV